MNDKLKAFERLLNIMDDLREKCPWDRKQTIHSLRNLTLEESYELADAILKEDFQGVKEEIGDLMLHMVFYSKIASELGHFDIAGALNQVCEKLILRHPHIYGDISVSGEQEVRKNWEKIKQSEGKSSVLSGVPDALPAVIKAYRMQEKTAQVGFEWENKNQVWSKVEEELKEFRETVGQWDFDKKEEEFGDILFSLINYARFEGIDPETALEKVNQKFKKRFEFIEKNAHKDLDEMSLEEMDLLWEKSKVKDHSEVKNK
ncbi:MAG TPA: nucleoside triphosphate pyrophosphohydrolase [Saprospiraceae bacterium]|nr:nucleoside triphosphate pyrophosphohydrolase [Saprospiraceae bacterium]